MGIGVDSIPTGYSVFEYLLSRVNEPFLSLREAASLKMGYTPELPGASVLRIHLTEFSSTSISTGVLILGIYHGNENTTDARFDGSSIYS
jgi:hypothetical protein